MDAMNGGNERLAVVETKVAAIEKTVERMDTKLDQTLTQLSDLTTSMDVMKKAQVATEAASTATSHVDRLIRWGGLTVGLMNLLILLAAAAALRLTGF